jgi:hypothetical protein
MSPFTGCACFAAALWLIRSPENADYDLHRNDANHQVSHPAGERRKIKQRDEAERDDHYQNCGDDSQDRLL